MRRLSPPQPAVLDRAEEAIECVVDAVAGDEATLRPLAAADAGYIPRLGRAAALVFAVDGRRDRVEGAVHRAAARGGGGTGGGGGGCPAFSRAPARPSRPAARRPAPASSWRSSSASRPAAF